MAIRFARIGDVVLLLPALARLKLAFEGARLTLVTGSPCAPVARLCPYIDEVISVDRLRMRDGPKSQALREMFQLVRGLRSQRFDLAVDFHSFRETNLLAWLSGARHRLGMKRSDRAYLSLCFNLPPVLEDKSLHVAEMFQAVAAGIPGVAGTLPPDSPVIRVPSPKTRGSKRSAVFYVGASVPERRWPASRFAELARFIVKAGDVTVTILSGTSESELAIATQIETEAGIGGRLRCLTRLGIQDLVTEIDTADLLVSNDSGPMHIGAELGVPTVGIFSSSLPEHYRPKGSRSRYVRKESIQEVQVEDVAGLIEDLWASPDRRS